MPAKTRILRRGNRAEGTGSIVELSELTAYAEEKYHIREQHKWADFPGFSVLADPDTGKWAALLMRQWDSETGTQIERCDIRCGAAGAEARSAPYLSPPYRMRGRDWVGVAFDGGAEPEVVFRLFDRALGDRARHGFTIVLDGGSAPDAAVFRASLLPAAGARALPPDADAPDKLREMLALYEYGRDSFQSKCKNFYRQGVCMAAYEDDAPWNGEWKRYFPTYHDMNLRQLRGYFTWRARLRRGEWRGAASSFAYVYLYELLNGIGTSSAEDALQKMREFEAGYLDSGIGDPGIRKYLRRWMLEFAVLRALPAETVRQCADAATLEKDRALAALRSPAEHSDEAVFSALCAFSERNAAESPVVAKDANRGARLFADAWRAAAADGLFAAVFGERRFFAWRPLSNAVYWEQSRPPDTDFVLNECRSYRCRSGVWQEARYDSLYFDWDKLGALLHETDRQLRKYLKTGRYLREKPGEAWAAPYAEAAIAADRRAVLEASRPRLTIDLSGLDRIRRDALSTRDSLLSEEERRELAESERPVEAPVAGPAAAPALDGLQTRILAALLRGEPVKELLAAGRLMPSVVADSINEALFDALGDTALDCDGDTLAVVEDYREELARIVGGNNG